MCICIFTLVGVPSAVSQTSAYSLVYQRAALGSLTSMFAQETIRSNSQDSYLLLATEQPGLLLRSNDRGMSFENASSPSDYARVEASPAMFLWENESASIIGNTLDQSIGSTSLVSKGNGINFEKSSNWPGGGSNQPTRTCEPGIATEASRFTLDHGRSWKSIKVTAGGIGGNTEKIYSARFGILGKGSSGSWYAIDTATGDQNIQTIIPARYRQIRSAQNGTLIGISDSMIAWLHPNDTTFIEQDLFTLPGEANRRSLQIRENVTWRGNRIFSLATTGDEWYLLTITEDTVRAIYLQRSANGNRFIQYRFDEPGCLIAETDRDGRPLEHRLFDDSGKLVGRPEITRHSSFATESKVTWSDSATYLFEIELNDRNPCHLYRISHDTPDRVEHVGKSFTGDASRAYRPMSVCLLDTMNGLLVGRDGRGALLEYTTEGEMRGFLIRGGYTISEQETIELKFEHSVPRLITRDSLFVVGTSDARIETINGRSYGYIWNEKNPLTMLQRSADSTFYFGRRDIIHASYAGVPLDTINVSLPGENRDSVGVLSDIAEIDKQNLVVALRGYNKRTYDEEPISTVRGGLAFTTDRGATWKRAIVPTQDQAYYSIKKLRNGALLSVSVDAAILSDSASKTSAVRCYSGNILRSTNGGITWTSQATFSLRNQTLSRCSYRIWQGNERIFVATPEAVMISSNDGVTWTAVNDFPLNCIINGVAEYKGQLYVATTMGIYRENAQTTVTEKVVRDQPSIQASAKHSGHAWRITVTGLPTSRILGIDVYDIQGRQHPTEQLWSQDNTASITSPLPSHGVYGVVVHGPNGQRWTTAVGVVE